MSGLGIEIDSRDGAVMSAAGLNAEVRQAFTRARLDRIIDLYGSVDGALAA